MFGFGGGCGEHPMSVEEGWSFCEVGAGGCDRLSNDKRGSKSAEENMEMATESCSKKKIDNNNGNTCFSSCDDTSVNPLL